LIETRALAHSLGVPVASFSWRPYRYATSHRLEELDVVLDDGTHLELLFKDLRRTEFGETALRAKPASIHDPRREAEAYRILAEAHLGTPTCYGAADDWLLLEKVQGVELWQVGNRETWVGVARWLARCHAHFAQNPPAGKRLIRYDSDYFRVWRDRVRERHPQLAGVVARHDRVVELLTDLPPTFIHGELYPSNVIVAGKRVAPVDWEMAGIGPGVLDIAALVTGWHEPDRSAILAGYGAVAADALDAASIQLAFQWLGWSSDWNPPPEHARDWLAEALASASRLGL
jgi:aminoglycoside phosphotransferase (APT) family kinase protein